MFLIGHSNAMQCNALLAKDFLFSFLQASLGFAVYWLLLPGVSREIELFSCRLIVTWQQQILHEAEECRVQCIFLGEDIMPYKT